MQIPSKKEICERLGIAALNKMQEDAHDVICRENNVVLLSPTGSGKTIGFLLPVLQTLKTKANGIQCLILVPSRELAIQVEKVWKTMATGFKVNTFYGGHDIETEINNLTEPPALLIGTPGRIADHITRGTFSPDALTTIVLDEFDKSLSLGFEEQMSFIISKLPRIHKRVLVSATPAISIPAFTGIQSPAVLNYITENEDTGLELRTVISDEKDKLNTLFLLLCTIGAESTLIFCNHREAVERISKHLSERSIDNAFFHGGLEQIEREQTLIRFRNGSVYFMVATDLAARGLDIPSVRHIIHYHLPGTSEEFVHRNGRTARMNATGTAYLLLHKDEHLPEWIPEAPVIMELSENNPIPPSSPWTTIYISGGKKDKVNKADIVGFFIKTGGLDKTELGMIEIKDHLAFAAVKKNKAKELIAKVQNEKMKGKKYKVALAR